MDIHNYGLNQFDANFAGNLHLDNQLQQALIMLIPINTNNNVIYQ